MPTYAIQTQHLTRRFGDVLAVDRVRLNVPAKSVYGFLGPNGAGKTTTIRLLLGLIRADDGIVQLFGEPLHRKRLALMRRVGTLVETPSLYPNLTGRENLELIRNLCGAPREAIDRALKTVRLTDAADRLARRYSLGMQQRLGLAIALLNGPDLLILDEPTNGLDPAGIQEVRELIRELPERGITVFLSSHLLVEVEQVATHIGIIQRGRLLFEGELEDLHAHRKEHIVVGTDQPEEATRLLAQEGWRAAPTPNGAARTDLIVAASGIEAAAHINRTLVTHGLNVYDLRARQSTLEDIFLRLTHAEDKESASQ
jgi:ABC-type multidrug transport system ATPase subunit